VSTLFKANGGVLHEMPRADLFHINRFARFAPLQNDYERLRRMQVDKTNLKLVAALLVHFAKTKPTRSTKPTNSCAVYYRVGSTVYTER